MRPIRIALINDYDVVVEGLATMLRLYSERVVVRALSTSNDVSAEVDIALYDSFANPPADRGIIAELMANARVGKVVVYAWDAEPTGADALAAGAAAVLSKKLPAAELVDALERIHADDAAPAVYVGRSDTAGSIAGDWPGREEGLTQREAEILALIVQGLSNADIVEQTGLSINSVKTYIRTCYRRIGVNTRAQAVLWGVNHGFVPDRKRRR
ncbi:helix-turn-helix transcriptional regulator [Gordonia neofelifaecis]|uniref:LuxR family two component transcriptional regulator n=1 Tax=Gordonia neofelifaecis NRRL B-59395 TaxID=644548 RepID=F1YPQ9_9ACTN|nr:response regulator transcription factor [Gordonia neofelifaecis]EGD53338.1 LuxR family two component transcriptional regulator [Gordonia neofelifaecis NRRL B-59395]